MKAPTEFQAQEGSLQNTQPRRLPVIPRRILGFGLLLAVAALPVSGEHLWAPYGENGVGLLKTKTGWQTTGITQPVPLGPGARVDQLVVGADAWWATAVEPADGEDRLMLLRGTAEAVESLPAPKVEQAQVILQPQLLVGPAGLEAAVWIEGKSHQATRVQAARWSGSGWAQPETLAPTGPGTQIALQAVRLSDGSFLAVWSAYDGTDDEIVWSRQNGEGWSAPVALSKNEVPDVTPALRAMGDGALVVWSAYDGNDYRLYSASFNGSSWTPGQKIGKRGSVFPSFAATEEPMVIFQQSAPRSWAFVELNFRAQVQRTAATDYRRERPVVTGRTAQGVEILWHNQGAEKASTSSESVTWTSDVR